MRVALMIGLVLFCCVTASAQTWQSIGPPGGDVRSLAQDPENASQLYLGTTDGHVFGSADAGEHWNLLGRVSERTDSVIDAMVVDPRHAAKLYAAAWTQDPAAGGGVFVSDDGGRTWQASGLAGQAVRALAQAPSDPDRLIAGTLQGIFGSHDAGRSWERLSSESNAELHNLDSLAVDPQRADVVYAGTFHLPWKSTDGGRTWNPIHAGMIDDSDVMSLLVDRANPQRVYASACSGIYRSENGAALWQKIQGIPYTARRTHVIVQDPVHPQTIYAGTTEGLWKSNDAGASWSQLTPADWIINAIALPAGHPDRVVLGTEKLGVLLSDDGGAHFAAANAGFDHRQLASVAFDVGHPGRIMVMLAHAPEPLLVTDDNGLHWAPLGPGLTMRDLKLAYAAPNGWWAALEGGGLMRYDAGKSAWARAGVLDWHPGDAGADKHPTPRDAKPVRRSRPVAVDGARPLDLVVNDMAFSHTRWFAATEGGLLESADQGMRWHQLPIGPLINSSVSSVRVSNDGLSLWVVSMRGLVFSTDGGKSWSWHDLPLESGGALQLVLAPSPAEPEGQTLLVKANHGLFISRDGGHSWQQAAAGLPEAPVEGLTVAGDLVVVSPHLGGLFVSRDRGETWTRVEGKLAEGSFPAVAAQGAGLTIFAASATDGLYSVMF